MSQHGTPRDLGELREAAPRNSQPDTGPGQQYEVRYVRGDGYGTVPGFTGEEAAWAYARTLPWPAWAQPAA